MHWYVDVLRKYAVFSGRARRQEYWMFVLANVFVMAFFQVTIAVVQTVPDSPIRSSRLVLLLCAFVAYCLFIALPALAVSVRRLHDTDHSGWWILLGFLPLIGGIVLLIWHVLDGTPGENRFGPDPKERPVPAVA